MAGQRIGYVRVSTFDQNPERRLDMKQIVLLNVDLIVQGLAGMPIDCDITLAFHKVTPGESGAARFERSDWR
jgi:hypothetical protein